MSLPTLLIFDIDDTLLKPNVFHNTTQIYKALLDPRLLIPLLNNPKYQISLASYNTDIGIGYGGYKLGRAILELQNLSSINSNISVPDAFIQCWNFQKGSDMYRFGKNVHINRIISAYKQRYGSLPKRVLFFDDNKHNIEMAQKIGIYSVWTPTGLTRLNMVL
jgi:hypothetical protein